MCISDTEVYLKKKKTLIVLSGFLVLNFCAYTYAFRVGKGHVRITLKNNAQTERVENKVETKSAEDHKEEKTRAYMIVVVVVAVLKKEHIAVTSSTITPSLHMTL